jgi:hypothetical protein
VYEGVYHDFLLVHDEVFDDMSTGAARSTRAGYHVRSGTPTRFGSKLTGPRDVAYKTGLRLQTD